MKLLITIIVAIVVFVGFLIYWKDELFDDILGFIVVVMFSVVFAYLAFWFMCIIFRI